MRRAPAIVRVAGEAIDGRDEKARTRARRDTIGFVYQFHHLLPEFTALENVALPQRAAGRATGGGGGARGRDLLAAVGLAARVGHRPAELSGGEQQRVAVARALANRPRLLLADEPTGNLDPETSAAVFAMLMALVRETGLAALIATHNLELAAQMDRCLRLVAGASSRAERPGGCGQSQTALSAAQSAASSRAGPARRADNAAASMPPAAAAKGRGSIPAS